MSWLDDALNGVVRGLGISGPAGPTLTPQQDAAFTRIANNPKVQAQENAGAATAGLGPVGTGTASGGTGATAVGTPFAGAKGWLLGFGLLAGVTLLLSDSGKYAGLGTAVLALIVVSYFFVEYGRITQGFGQLFNGPDLNPKGA